MIGIIIFVLFFFLLGKALLETVWGLCLITCGMFWHIVGRSLDVLIFISKTVKKFQKSQVTQQPFFKAARSHRI